MKIALIGNPNCGKTALFNRLTGSTAHVGNWPGVTVEKRTGVYKSEKTGEKIEIVDLPGIYSLSPYTPEETVSRDYMLDGDPDLVINVVDVTNLERNLYLTTQALETDMPVLVALNMMDAAERDGDVIDVGKLESALGVPVAAISALKGTGIDDMMARAVSVEKRRKGSTVLRGGALSKAVQTAYEWYCDRAIASPLFHAVKLLENDESELARDGAKELRGQIVGAETDAEAIVVDERYRFIASELATAKKKAKRENRSASDKADRLLTHRIWAIPVFAVIMFSIFHLTFSEDFLYIGAWAGLGGGLPKAVDLGLSQGMETFVGIFYDGAVFSPGVILFNMFDTLFGTIQGAVGGAINARWLSGLIADGVLGGLFAVLGFLPQILLLFMWFSILEDTGYMARIAFVLDRIFRKLGLSGRSVMPMIMGFGCSVPAMINTRTLADENERTATVRVIPFFSCGAKLPILTAIAGAVCGYFGVGNADVITYGMYVLGVCVAVVTVLLMRNTTLKGESAPFIMELPTYRRPRFASLTLRLWDKAKHFVKKAFTVIFASTVLIWLFSHLDWSWHYIPDAEMNKSILASLGKFIQPVFTPMGFGSQLGAYGWVFAVATVTGLVAKENVIATFGTLGACLIAMGVDVGGITGDMLVADEEGIAAAVAMIAATGITVPALMAFIAFNMLTVPCFAACATAKSELKKGAFRYTLLFWILTSATVGAVVYTVGTRWWTVFAWLAAAAVVVAFVALFARGKIKLPKRRRGKKSEKIGACGGRCGSCAFGCSRSDAESDGERE